MRKILRYNNIGLLREIELLGNLLNEMSSAISTELNSYYNWAVSKCQELRLQVMQNLNDLDLHQEAIIPDILSATQALTRDFYLFSQRQVSPILRARNSDRLCLKILRWLHAVHTVTRDIPLALSDEEFQIWPVHPTIYFMPPPAQHGLLYLPLFFHEFGHLLYTCHESEMDDLVRCLQQDIDELLKPSVHQDDIHAERETQRRKVIVERWYEWAQEFFCDAVGLCIAGKSFLNAFSMYLRMRGRGEYHVPEDELTEQSHPVTWLRVSMLTDRARLMGYGVESDELKDAWNAIAKEMHIKEDYYGYYTTEFKPAIHNTINDMLTEASPFGFYQEHQPISEQNDSSPIPLLNEAWQRFFQNPESYRLWEEKAVAIYLKQ